MTFTTRLPQLNTVLPMIVDKELPVPTIFSNDEQGFDLVWDTPKGRVTLYIGEMYEVEIVPHGSLVPVSTDNAEEAIEYVTEYYVHKLSSDFEAEFLEQLEKNREEVYQRRLQKNAQKKKKK